MDIKVETLDIDGPLKLFVAEGLVVKAIDIAALKKFLGLSVDVL